MLSQQRVTTLIGYTELPAEVNVDKFNWLNLDHALKS